MIEKRLYNFLDSQKINGKSDTNMLNDINGLSNLKLSASRNHGLIPITIEDKVKARLTFFEGNKTKSKVTLAKVKINAEIIFVESPGSVK